jgi:hypothetical protein
MKLQIEGTSPMDIHWKIVGVKISLCSLMLIAMLSSGCGSRSIQTGDGEGDAEIRCNGAGVVTELYIPQGFAANLDILFVIDNSPSMADKQQSARWIPALASVQVFSERTLPS